MDAFEKREALKRISTGCRDLLDIANEADLKMIGLMLDMVILQANKSLAGDGTIDGAVDGHD